MYAQREIAYVQDTIKDRSKIFWEIIFFRAITMTVSIIIFFCTFVNGNNDYKTYYLIFSLELISNCFDITWFFQGLEDFKKCYKKYYCKIDINFIDFYVSKNFK